ncbi:MAG TPA: dTMP kinase [Burkholderiaceae bacterium]|nr:dTMP kinase [Burkholderiaceae bacterium]
MSGRGRFLTFEGIDGAGKSSHVEWLARRLRERGRAVVVTREPGGTELAEAIRDWVLNRPMSMRVEALLVFAARQDHLDRVIRPALQAGTWVVCDRFTDSTVAYQGGGRGMPVADIAALEAWVHPDLQPDLTWLFDLDPAEAARRRQAARPADRFEAEDTAFFARVRHAYLERAAAAPGRFVRIDGTRPIDAIRASIELDLARL